MRRAATHLRWGAWLSLLGSVLALIGFFFLPYTAYAQESLGDCFTSCALDQLFPSYSFSFQPVPWGNGALLLLLLSIAVLALLALFLRSPRWNISALFVRLTCLTLFFYVFSTLALLLSYWVALTISATGTEDTQQETLHATSSGVWLILAGLLLAFIGWLLSDRPKTKTKPEGGPTGPTNAVSE